MKEGHRNRYFVAVAGVFSFLELIRGASGIKEVHDDSAQEDSVILQATEGKS